MELVVGNSATMGAGGFGNWGNSYLISNQIHISTYIKLKMAIEEKDKTPCIFCDKPTATDEMTNWGDELACSKCDNDMQNELEKNGKEVEIIYPVGIFKKYDLIGYIDENFEWFEAQLGSTPSFYRILKMEMNKATIKYI